MYHLQLSCRPRIAFASPPPQTSLSKSQQDHLRIKTSAAQNPLHQTIERSLSIESLSISLTMVQSRDLPAVLESCVRAPLLTASPPSSTGNISNTSVCIMSDTFESSDCRATLLSSSSKLPRSRARGAVQGLALSLDLKHQRKHLRVSERAHTHARVFATMCVHSLDFTLDPMWLQKSHRLNEREHAF